MEQNTPTRRKKKKQNQKSAGCCGLMVALVLLLIFLLLCFLLMPEDEGRMNNNPYSPSDFITFGGYLHCTEGRSRLGVDVSEYQEEIDWETVRAEGFEFAFIRIGYRGYTTGQIMEDDRARENLKAAKDAGMDVGVYFYSQATNTSEALEEAQWCLEFLSGTPLDHPVVYDWEYVNASARTGSVTRDTLTECAKTFCDAISESGYEGAIYFNNHISRDLLDLEQLQDYPWWLAQYSSGLDFPHRIDFWQYTDSGSVPGIEGKVDIDIMFQY